jgi:hypothetical protein
MDPILIITQAAVGLGQHDGFCYCLELASRFSSAME